VGELKFLTLNLPKHPLYPRIRSILKAEIPSSPLPELLDLGCCVAQELRSLTHFGSVPSSQLYGSDLIAPYLKTSYQLFNDEETFKGTLVSGDIFSATLFGEDPSLMYSSDYLIFDERW